MPEYVEDIEAELKAREVRLLNSIRITPVKWAYGPALDDVRKQLNLASAGVHYIVGNVCNCGLIVGRTIKHGHREHKTKVPVNTFEIVITL
jgi:hypothetical protein